MPSQSKKKSVPDTAAVPSVLGGGTHRQLLPSATLPPEEILARGQGVQSARVVHAAEELLRKSQSSEFESMGFGPAWRAALEKEVVALREAVDQSARELRGAKERGVKQGVVKMASVWMRRAGALLRRSPSRMADLPRHDRPSQLVATLRALIAVLREEASLQAGCHPDQGEAHLAAVLAATESKEAAAEARHQRLLVETEGRGLILLELARLCDVGRVLYPARSREFSLGRALGAKRSPPGDMPPAAEPPEDQAPPSRAA